MKPPFDLRRKTGGKPLAVLFETRRAAPATRCMARAFSAPRCAHCSRVSTSRALRSTTPASYVTPTAAQAHRVSWARELNVNYTPTVVFFDQGNREVFRFEGYLRPFHLTGAFDYVAQGAYRTQPEFQRFLQNKADRSRERQAGRPLALKASRAVWAIGPRRSRRNSVCLPRSVETDHNWRRRPSMDIKLHLLESFEARGSDGHTYKVMGYERLARDESVPNALERWSPTGTGEYRLADGGLVDAVTAMVRCASTTAA